MIASELANSEKGQPKKYSDYELELNTFVRKHFPHWGAKDLAVK
jgi:sulfate adenylyltransferase subunit 1